MGRIMHTEVQEQDIRGGKLIKSYSRMEVLTPKMKFQNDYGQAVEINFENFEAILAKEQFGLIPVKLKNGKIEWIRATAYEVLEAAAEE